MLFYFFPITPQSWPVLNIAAPIVNVWIMQIASICTVLYSIHPERLWQILPVYGNFYPFIRLPAPPGALLPIRESRLPASKCTLNVRHTDYSEKINSYRWRQRSSARPHTGKAKMQLPEIFSVGVKQCWGGGGCALSSLLIGLLLSETRGTRYIQRASFSKGFLRLLNDFNLQ